MLSPSEEDDGNDREEVESEQSEEEQAGSAVDEWTSHPADSLAHWEAANPPATFIGSAAAAAADEEDEEEEENEEAEEDAAEDVAEADGGRAVTAARADNRGGFSDPSRDLAVDDDDDDDDDEGEGPYDSQ